MMQTLMSETVARVMRQVCQKWQPPRKIKTRDWANQHRYLSSIEAARPGKYNLGITPYLEWENSPLDALDDPNVQVVCCQKSAQVAWTSGVLGNYLGKTIDTDPSPILEVNDILAIISTKSKHKLMTRYFHNDVLIYRTVLPAHENALIVQKRFLPSA